MIDRLASRRTRRRPSGSESRDSTTRARRCSRRPSPPPRRRRPRRACPRARTREARAFARRTSPPSREVRPTTPAMRPRRHGLDDALSTLDAHRAIDHRRARRRMNILSVDIRARSRVHDVACGRIDVAMGVEWKPYRLKKPCGHETRRRRGGGERDDEERETDDFFLISLRKHSRRRDDGEDDAERSEASTASP